MVLLGSIVRRDIITYNKCRRDGAFSFQSLAARQCIYVHRSVKDLNNDTENSRKETTAYSHPLQ
jgi:hypothetical protein